jgi:uncharacterized protein DUF2793
MSGERALPGVGLYGFWTPGSSGYNTNLDISLRKASALLQCSVKSRVTALPGSPSDGDMYIVPHSAGSNADQIAIRDNGAWVYFVPTEGWKAWCQDTDEVATFDGSIWTAQFAPRTAPANPSSGWSFPYSDSADGNKLKVRDSSGNVVVLAQ